MREYTNLQQSITVRKEVKELSLSSIELCVRVSPSSSSSFVVRTMVRMSFAAMPFLENWLIVLCRCSFTCYRNSPFTVHLV